jgi:tetratricopeptide (TPR) repeat protein
MEWSVHRGRVEWAHLENLQRGSSLGQARKDILNGWKEIATYVGRDIRTVERWEKQRGLPILRLPRAGRATVYALVDELDQWFASDGSGQEQDLGEDAKGASPELPVIDETLVRPWWRWVVPASVVLLCVISVAAALVLRREHRERAAGPHGAAIAAPHYSFDAARNPDGVPYPSRVAGVDELCLRGIYSSEQRTAGSLKDSLQYFNQAIAKDPAYAPAYSGLAYTYLLTREYAVLTDPKAYSLAGDAAQKAIELDPNLAQAHAALGFIDFFWSADPVAAEREFRMALRLNPSGVLSHHWYGSVLTHEGRYPEALDQLNLAQHLEPTSAAILSSRALALGLSGHRDEAVDMMKELLNEVPEASPPHQIIAILSLVEPRDVPRWLDETRQIEDMRQDSQQGRRIERAAAAYRSGGEKEMWESLLRTDGEGLAAATPRPFTMASDEAALGNFEAAFAILLPAVQRHDRQAVIVAMDPVLAELRNDPRFAQLLMETRIPEAEKIR